MFNVRYEAMVLYKSLIVWLYAGTIKSNRTSMQKGQVLVAMTSTALSLMRLWTLSVMTPFSCS